MKREWRIKKTIDCSKTENYFAEKQRMTKRLKGGICKLDCRKCPLYSSNNGTSGSTSCSDCEAFYTEKAISAIQKWSNEHPQKTYLSEFLKNYPNAELNRNGTPKWLLCPHQLGLKDIDSCKIDNACVKCWNKPIEDGEE